MTIYITTEGDKVIADSPMELVGKLQRLQGKIEETQRDFMNRLAKEIGAIQGVTIPITDPGTFIAELIHNDYLSVVDSIDG
jgi:hypothetical protein